jgi:hypothetical protein
VPPVLMGALISKLCCCTNKGQGRRHDQPKKFIYKSQSKLSKNSSLIIERTHVQGDEDGGSEYSRVLEKDFEIKGRRVVKKSQLSNNEAIVDILNGEVCVKRSESILKVMNTSEICFKKLIFIHS